MLGGDGTNERPNGSVCTPGTNVKVNGVRVYDHCISSTSKTFHSDQWVLFELVVYGDSLAHHIINDDTVMTYTNFQLEDGGNPLGSGHQPCNPRATPQNFEKLNCLTSNHRSALLF